MGLKKKLLKKKSQKWDVKPNEMLWNNVLAYCKIAIKRGLSM